MKFDMSRAWDEAVAMLGANSGMVTVIAGVFFFLPYVILGLIAPDPSQNPAMQATAADADAVMQAMMAVYSEIWWMVLIVMLVQGVGTLALYALLTHSNRPTVGEAIAFGFGGLLPFIGVLLLQLAIMLVVLGLPIALAAQSGSLIVGALVSLLVLVGTAYLYTKFSLSVAVLGIGRERSPATALRQSWTLTKGNSVRLWLFYVLLIIAFLIVSAVVGMIFGVVFGLAGAEIARFGNALVSAMLNAVFVTILLAVVGAVYRQLSGGTPQSIVETFE